MRKERVFLQEKFGFNLDKYSKVDKRKLLRNCVVPELGLHIFNSSLEKKYTQNSLTKTAFNKPNTHLREKQ